MILVTLLYHVIWVGFIVEELLESKHMNVTSPHTTFLLATACQRAPNQWRYSSQSYHVLTAQCDKLARTTRVCQRPPAQRRTRLICLFFYYLKVCLALLVKFQQCLETVTGTCNYVSMTFLRTSHSVYRPYVTVHAYDSFLAYCAVSCAVFEYVSMHHQS